MVFISNRIFVISLVLIHLYLDDSIAVDPGDVDKYLQAGTKLLAAGQLADALVQYELAIEGDPKNYLIYYRRATVYLAMGKIKSAVEDLTVALDIKSDFDLARSQRANLYLKQGKLVEAKEDASTVLKHLPNDEKSQSLLQTIGELADSIESAKTYYSNDQYEQSIEYLNHAIEISNLNLELRELRANCYMKLGDTKKAISDFRQTVKLTNDDREGILRLSVLLYEVGDPDQSLIEIRECLRLDPDHKACFAHYKMIKKLAKLISVIQESQKSNNYEECIKKSNKLLKLEPNYTNIAIQFLCSCHSKGGDAKKALEYCQTAHDKDPSNLDVLLDMAEAYISNDDFNTAIKYYQKVLDVDRDNARAKKGMTKAQKMLKNSKKRNYYKILGVEKTASKNQILRAYRKLAAKYHPDHYKGKDKKYAEKMFIDVTDSKEVLTDPEKRKVFNEGGDPFDPEQQYQGPSGNPFGGFTFHNFNPFEHGGAGGGGFNYEFHFG